MIRSNSGVDGEGAPGGVGAPKDMRMLTSSRFHHIIGHHTTETQRPNMTAPTTALTLSQRYNSMWTIYNHDGDIVFSGHSYVQARARLDIMNEVLRLEASESYQKWLMERDAEFCTE